MKFIIISILSVMAVVLLGSIITVLFLFQKEVLEYNNISYFQTQMITKNNRNYLLISGEYGIMNSTPHIIKEIKEEFENGDIMIKVYTRLPGGRRDSSFIYPVKIDKDVNRILFGNEKKVIWTKNDNPDPK